MNWQLKAANLLHSRADVPKRKEGNDVEGDLAKFAEALNATVVVFEAIGGKQTQVINSSYTP